MLKEWLKSIDKRPLQAKMQDDTRSRLATLDLREGGGVLDALAVAYDAAVTASPGRVSSPVRVTETLPPKPVSATPSLDKIIEASKSRTLLADADYDTLKAQRDHAKGVLDSLMGIERASAAPIRGAIAKISIAMRYHEFRAAGETFMPMSLEGFTWRHKNGNPKLAIFSLESPHFGVSTHAHFDGGLTSFEMSDGTVAWHRNVDNMQPRLPSAIRECYSDVRQALMLRGSVRESHTLSATFTGVIPADIKETIRRVKDQFDSLYIVAEPDGFEIKSEAVIPEGDPLLVGWINDPASLWLIADFDTTPVEEAMMLAK